jgi:hypothetical protein
LKRKINLTKGEKNQKNKDKIRKTKYIINLDWRVKFKTSKLLQKSKGKKLEIKRRMTKLKKLIHDKLEFKH